MTLKTVTLAERPHCDVCGAPAHYDSKTIYGPWAYLCTKCYGEVGSSVHATRLTVEGEK